MDDLFERKYAKHGNKVVPIPCKYVGIVSTCSSSAQKRKHWDSYICGCNGGGDCDACDS